MKTLITLSSLFLLTACGADNGDPGSSCHTEDTKTGARIWCDDGSEAVLTDGEDGAEGKDGAMGADGAEGTKGAAGPKGADGQDGDPAEATHIIESFYCGAGLENTTLWYGYSAVLWSSGDLFVSGSVSSPLNQASTTALFTPTQNGYLDASVSFTFDQDGTANGGWFKLSLNRSTLTSVIEYRAADPGPVTDSWTLPPEACVHNTY
jgi:hypothetical protein